MKHKVSCPICKSIEVFAIYTEEIGLKTRTFHCETCSCWYDIKNFTMIKNKLIFKEKTRIIKNKKYSYIDV